MTFSKGAAREGGAATIRVLIAPQCGGRSLADDGDDLAGEPFVTIVATPRAAQLGLNRIGGAPGADPGTLIRAAARAPLAELAGSGQLKIVVAGTYQPLDQAAEAHRQLLTGHTVGKLVIIP